MTLSPHHDRPVVARLPSRHVSRDSYGPNAFTALCFDENVSQRFTRPYTSRTNGKAERFIQTLERRWAYRCAYRTSAIRAASLRAWIAHYDHYRPHRAIGKIPPITRLRA